MEWTIFFVSHIDPLLQCSLGNSRIFAYTRTHQRRFISAKNNNNNNNNNTIHTELPLTTKTRYNNKIKQCHNSHSHCINIDMHMCCCTMTSLHPYSCLFVCLSLQAISSYLTVSENSCGCEFGCVWVSLYRKNRCNKRNLEKIMRWIQQQQ